MTMRSLIGSDNRPMTKQESEMFISVMLNPELDTQFDEQFANKLGFSGKLLYSRLSEFSKAKITRGLALFVVVLSNGNPGNLVMWTYTIHKMYKGKVVTIHDFVDQFPFGVPSEEGLSAVWDAQKSPTGANMIDNIANW